jgi:hypothetical protein
MLKNVYLGPEMKENSDIKLNSRIVFYINKAWPKSYYVPSIQIRRGKVPHEIFV